MPTFDSIAQGDEKRKPVTLPLLGATWDAERKAWDGPTVELEVCALTPGDDLEILRLANAFAKERGAVKLEVGDPTYDYAERLFTVLLACVDKDVPAPERKPFFSSVESILNSRLISQDAIELLYEHQQLHQGEVSPRAKDMSPAEYMATLVAVAGGNVDFFLAQRPSTRWVFTRTLAVQQLGLLTLKSESTSSDDSSSAPTTPAG